MTGLLRMATLLNMCLLASTVHSASFDCQKATLKLDKVICADDGLSKLDEEVAHAYKRALARSQGPEVTKAEQIRWLKKRGACRENIECLKSSYKVRIVEVTRDEYENPSGWWMREGVGGELCDALHRRLADYRREDIDGCPVGMALSIPGLKEADGWRELNPVDHVDLINKLRFYTVLNLPDAYFEIWSETDYGQYQRNKVEQVKELLAPYLYTRKIVEDMVRQEGLRLRVQRFSIIRHSVGLGFVNQVEGQTLLEVRSSKRTQPAVVPYSVFSSGNFRHGNCPLTKEQDAGGEIVRSYFVSPDLADLDPAMRGTPVTNDRLVNYKGKLYFMGHVSSFGTLFKESYTTGALHSFCGIEWHGAKRWPELNLSQSQSHQ